MMRLLLLLALSAAPVFAQPEWASFAWLDANLMLRLPVTWNIRTDGDGTRVLADGAEGRFSARLLPENTPDAAFYDALYADVVDLGLAAQRWSQPIWFGRAGGRIDAGGGAGMIGRLPDDRVLVAVCACSAELFAALLAGVGLSAELPPADRSLVLPGTAAQGTLSADQTEQIWRFVGRTGSAVTISAVDLARPDPYSVALDMEILVFDPNGTQIAANDDHGGVDLFGVYDAQLRDLILPLDGVYRVVVRAVQSTSGVYTLGISLPTRIALNESGITQLDGRIQAVFPRQRWQFEGRQGQIVTITMQTISGTLDPLLELFSPSGRRIAYNDDAADPALGVNAQLVRTELPRDGLYSLDATRFSGTGAYRLIIAS